MRRVVYFKFPKDYWLIINKHWVSSQLSLRNCSLQSRSRSLEAIPEEPLGYRNTVEQQPGVKLEWFWTGSRAISLWALPQQGDGCGCPRRTFHTSWGSIQRQQQLRVPARASPGRAGRARLVLGHGAEQCPALGTARLKSVPATNEAITALLSCQDTRGQESVPALVSSWDSTSCFCNVLPQSY